MLSNTILPVILCGGSGTRLWPLSRKSFPKQFLSLNYKNNYSLIQNTLIRIKNLDNQSNPILICNEEHRFIIAEQMREINIIPSQIILEPFGRNTAPAIAVAALKSLEKGDDPNLLILSSDHHIENEEKFIEILNSGVKYSEKGRLVTFGVVPKSPETGYGYIKSKNTSSNSGYEIEAFIEKPNKEKAKSFLRDNRFTWNSGIFLFKASEILKEIEKFSPEIITFCKKSLDKKLYDLDFQRLNKKSFFNCPNISIDVAVMEKTSKGTVIPLDVGWNDIGCWDSLWEISKKDSKGNVVEGDVSIENTENCFLRSENRLIAGIGLKNLLIVETNDAILIAEKSQSQKVKNIVQKLQNEKKSQGIEHQKIFRPWGNYETLINSKNWQVKIIIVKAGEKISLQKHKYRSEHWVVVSGLAKVEIDSKILILEENQSTYIPQGSTHRLSNVGKEDLKIIEIQSGSYIGEDDIIRIEDEYGRNN